MPLKIHYPHKPYQISQHWGNANGEYATHFNDPSFKLHNGVDSITGYRNFDGTVATEFPVYCPVEGFKVLSVDYAPDGGGNEIWLISKEKYQMFEKECYALMVLCHAKKVLVQAGYEPALGELLTISDTTGFSTGLHVHTGLYRVDYNGTWFTKIDQNEATGSFSPELFFTGMYAVDQASLPTLIKNNMRYYQYKLGNFISK